MRKPGREHFGAPARALLFIDYGLCSLLFADRCLPAVVGYGCELSVTAACSLRAAASPEFLWSVRR